MGGEQLKLTPAIRAFFDALPEATMMNVYGPAEASIWVTEHRMKGNASAWPTIPPMGRPIVDAELFIVDEQLNLLPDGEAGEICIWDGAGHGDELSSTLRFIRLADRVNDPLMKAVESALTEVWHPARPRRADAPAATGGAGEPARGNLITRPGAEAVPA